MVARLTLFCIILNLSSNQTTNIVDFVTLYEHLRLFLLLLLLFKGFMYSESADKLSCSISNVVIDLGENPAAMQHGASARMIPIAGTMVLVLISQVFITTQHR